MAVEQGVAAENGAREAPEQEVYAPSPEIVAGANAKSYEEMARRAQQDLAGFWAEEANSSSGSSRGRKCWMTPTSPSTSGSWAARPISPTTAWTGTSRPGGATSWP